MSRALDSDTNLSIERLRELVFYDPETGIFTWLKKRRRCNPGAVAGCLRSDGSWRVRIDYHLYQAHRLAWFYVTGEWPVNEIDHKNRIRSDNRWENLRSATRVQNMINVVMNNRTGYSNVDKVGNRYRARASVNGKFTHLGMADTAAEAHAISVHERRKVHGDFVVSQIKEVMI